LEWEAIVSRIGIRQGLSRLVSIGSRFRARGYASILRRNERWVAEARSTPPLHGLYPSVWAADAPAE
jgi:hypothetical protein